MNIVLNRLTLSHTVSRRLTPSRAVSHRLTPSHAVSPSFWLILPLRARLGGRNRGSVLRGDVDQAAGPLRFVRGSHRWGVKYPDKGTHRQDPAVQQREIEALRNGAAEAAAAEVAVTAAAGADVDEPPLYSWEVVSSILPKGAVSFHDWRTVHGSDPNHSQNQRRGLAIHMCSAETVNEGGPLTAHLLDPRANPPPRATAGASRL
jgi:hypothetical protein